MMRVVAGAKSASPLGEQPVRNFLDLGCGDGILAATILEKYPQAKGTLVDFSMPMIQAAIRNLQAYSKSLHISSVGYSDPAWFDIISAHAPFDVVVSGFSIHHQPDPVKSQLYLVYSICWSRAACSSISNTSLRQHPTSKLSTTTISLTVCGQVS